MRGLKVLPSGRPGRGRLYVNQPDGRAVAWYDRETNRISVLADQHREAVLAALRPYLQRGYTLGPPPVPTAADLRRLALPPDEDLAPNRPGEALLGELAHGSAGARARHRMRLELLAQQRMGEELDALEPPEWRVLHAVPLPGAGLIDHLLIGPPGILCVRTVPGRRQRAAVGDLLLTVGRAEPRQDPRWIRLAATRAGRALTAPVIPALALVEASRVEVAPTVRDIRVLQPATALAYLAEAPVTLKPPDIEALFTLARDWRTWTGRPVGPAFRRPRR
ncbi:MULTISPECIES: nuclease-related domain-containing protein [unclassified Streptomyces]|uniref:nuclease-related domain-containing protein n=1 Tax=unclassified Streptomyces TaxID=2593676 RepID=UPI0022591C44|nr:MULTISPECIES: nuclease-related domain-containing protein [unclassified Streptomyces]MCX4528071.1 NERD domain-containing protein [Streptomyces sp. NBC_01551]MCX4541314.1 NERD domain-containing protein [Streptomyces sp. NBC_01565]